MKNSPRPRPTTFLLLAALATLALLLASCGSRAADAGGDLAADAVAVALGTD